MEDPRTDKNFLNQWDELRRFTGDGRLEIDNNTAERTLRLWAMSRKN
jgi:hypothetical protein